MEAPMPRSTREYLIRFYEQSTNHLDRTLFSLKKMHEIYDPNYPDHSAFIGELAGMVITLQELLTKFRQEMM